MHDQIPENITNGIKISVIDFFRYGDEKDKSSKTKGECELLSRRFIVALSSWQTFRDFSLCDGTKNVVFVVRAV